MARDRLLEIFKSGFYYRGMSRDVSDFKNNSDLCPKIQSQANLRHRRLILLRITLIALCVNK